MGLSRKICAPASASAPRSDKKAMRRASGDQRGVSSRFGCDVKRIACRISSTIQMSELKRSFSRSHELTTNATRRASGDIWASLARLSERTSSGVIGRFVCAETATTRRKGIKTTAKILRMFFIDTLSNDQLNLMRFGQIRRLPSRNQPVDYFWRNY